MLAPDFVRFWDDIPGACGFTLLSFVPITMVSVIAPLGQTTEAGSAIDFSVCLSGNHNAGVGHIDSFGKGAETVRVIEKLDGSVRVDDIAAFYTDVAQLHEEHLLAIEIKLTFVDFVSVCMILEEEFPESTMMTDMLLPHEDSNRLLEVVFLQVRVLSASVACVFKRVVSPVRFHQYKSVVAGAEQTLEDARA